MIDLDIVIGTRPEAIKLAPVIRRLHAADWARPRVVLTGQHDALVRSLLPGLAITPDRDLGPTEAGQPLEAAMAGLLTRLGELWRRDRPMMVLAQGDTSTVLAAALCAFYQGILFGHVEAGLRSGDLASPFPEELNRIMAGRLACLHFAPTAAARDALLAEGIAAATIHVTGNPVIDALVETLDGLPPQVAANGRRRILLTAHRRENFGPRLDGMFAALRRMIDVRDDVEILFPVHPNPAVRELAGKWLAGHPRIALVEPMEHAPFIAAMRDADVVVTDSGGVQEEALHLGRPLLVMRAETERREGLDRTGRALLVGTDPAILIDAIEAILDRPPPGPSPTTGPYGDGRAAERIVALIGRQFGTVADADLPPMFL